MKNSEQNVDFSLVLASSVHDMKNSIGMLIASIEDVIRDQPPENPEQEKRFSTLHYEASRINGELIQLLTLYRMQDNHLPLRIDQHYVVDVLEDQLARNHTLIETRGIKLNFECDDGLAWYFDHDLVGSVIHNVIVNCVRYSKEQLLVKAEVESQQLVITVAEDGPGYPDHMLAQPDGLVDHAAVNDGGTHLGMYFAAKIASLHKQNNQVGYVKLENNGPLGGGVFRLVLP